MGKSQFPSTFNWQSTNPATGFLPNPNTAGNSTPSGVVAGTMSSTNTIYTNILGIRQTDVQSIEVAWTGTPTGTLQVLVSNSGINWAPLVFNPALTQPSGSANNIFINIAEIGAQYMCLQYTNASGSGTIKAYSQCKAFNS